MKYKIWRQAYINSEGTLRPAKPISISEYGFTDALNKLEKVWPNSTRKKSIKNSTWCGLHLFVDKNKANKEPFNINKYEITNKWG